MISRRKFLLIGTYPLANFLTGCEKNESSASARAVTPVFNTTVDIATIFWDNNLVKILRFLKIILAAYTQITYNETNKTARFSTSNQKVIGNIDLSQTNNSTCRFETPRGIVDFAPNDFIKTYNITEGDEEALSKIDTEIITLLDQCTNEILSTGEGDHFKLLNLRASCIEKSISDQPTIDYIRIKHETYNI